ncbi:MAG TPA: glycosyltransferase family 39 protein [Anaerolinea sp.]|nr:glycosyltransferase family 39 protein [Anaerolinea sp.]
MIFRKNPIYFIVFISSILITSLFLLLLPKNWKVNESTDYSSFYEPVARNILAGKGYTRSGDSIDSFYPPGYPLILAMVFGLSKALYIPENVMITVFQVILTTVSVVLIFHLAQKVTNTKAALIAALVWMTYPFQLWLTKQPNSEIPFMAILFSGCAILFSASCFQICKKSPYLISGLFIGLAILTRPIAILFPLVLVISLYFSLSNIPGRKKVLLSIVFITGVLLPIIPWESFVYAKTGKVVLISENSSMALRGGLVFAISDNAYKQPVSVPPDVRLLMMEIKEQYDDLSSNEKIISFIGAKIIKTPLTIIKLFGIKALRSWYATDRQSYEKYIVLIQLPYVFLIISGSFLALKRGKTARKVLIGIWLLTLCNWGMTILVTSTLRYMVPVIGLQFVNIAHVPFFFFQRDQYQRNPRNSNS